METPFLGNAVMWLTGHQIADKLAVQGSTSSQWTTLIQCRAGACLLTWEKCGDKAVLRVRGELELDSAEEEEDGDTVGSADKYEDEGLEDYLQTSDRERIVVLVRDFLSSADALECALEDSSGILQDCTVHLPNCDSSGPA